MLFTWQSFIQTFSLNRLISDYWCPYELVLVRVKRIEVHAAEAKISNLFTRSPLLSKLGNLTTISPVRDFWRWRQLVKLRASGRDEAAAGKVRKIQFCLSSTPRFFFFYFLSLPLNSTHWTFKRHHWRTFTRRHTAGVIEVSLMQKHSPSPGNRPWCSFTRARKRITSLTCWDRRRITNMDPISAVTSSPADTFTTGCSYFIYSHLISVANRLGFF